MMRGALPMFALLALVAGGANADVASGKAKSRTLACAVCHGVLGISSAPDTPNLAAQPERYLGEQLKAYRSGKRTHEVMSVVAKSLTDADIEDLAAWFSSLQVEAREKP